MPVLSGRFGYELNLPRVQIKLGASGLKGPRNDQFDREAMIEMFGFDARLTVAGLALSGEYVHVHEEEGAGGKQTGAGGYLIASEFYANGFWAQAAYALKFGGALGAIIPYARYERRHAAFEGFRPITVARVTAGLRLDLWAGLISEGRVPVQSRAGRGARGGEQRADDVGGVRVVTGVLMAGLLVASGAGGAPAPATQAPLPIAPGHEAPLPIAVKTPQDLAFKAEVERQYLIVNLMAGGRIGIRGGRLRARRARLGGAVQDPQSAAGNRRAWLRRCSPTRTASVAGRARPRRPPPRPSPRSRRRRSRRCHAAAPPAADGQRHGDRRRTDRSRRRGGLVETARWSDAAARAADASVWSINWARRSSPTCSRLASATA